MQPLKTLGAAGALVAAAIIGGTLISSTLAAPPETGGDDGLPGGQYCDAYRDNLAAELGIETDALDAARRAAAEATIDAAVAAGDLSEERAAALKERLADGDGCAWLAHRPRHGPGHPHLADLLGAAAQSLGLDEADLIDRLRSGDTLADVAEAEGVDLAAVTGAVSDALDAALDEAVADGDLTQERADAIAKRVADALADGEWPGRVGLGRWHDREDAPAS